MEQEVKTYALAIDMVRTIGQPPFEVVWGDTGNVLHITLTNDGAPVNLADRYVCVVFRSGGGTALQDHTNGLSLLDAAAGVFSLRLLPQSYDAGDVSADIQVYSGENRETLITSRRFTFRCRNALLNDRTMQANGTYPPLIEATREANAAAALAREAAERNGDMTKAVYDADGSGVVDDAEKLGGKPPQDYAAAAHSHAPDDLSGALPVTKGGTGATTAAAARANLGAAALSELTPSAIGAEKARLERTATLQASAWVSNAQTIPVSGVTVSSLVVVSAAPASHVAYGEAGVYCSVQAEGSLTFSCSDVPTEDLSVNVVIWR